MSAAPALWTEDKLGVPSVFHRFGDMNMTQEERLTDKRITALQRESLGKNVATRPGAFAFLPRASAPGWRQRADTHPAGRNHPYPAD